jgi:hypothetical protein
MRRGGGLVLGLVLLVAATGGFRRDGLLFASYAANRSAQPVIVLFEEDEPTFPISIFNVGPGEAGTAVYGGGYVGWMGFVTVYGPRCAVIGRVRLEADERTIVLAPDLSVHVEGRSALSDDEQQHALPKGELRCDSAP